MSNYRKELLTEFLTLNYYVMRRRSFRMRRRAGRSRRRYVKLSRGGYRL